jgi:hypothetical protein
VASWPGGRTNEDRAARRGRLTPARMAKIRAILDDAVARLEALSSDE